MRALTEAKAIFMGGTLLGATLVLVPGAARSVDAEPQAEAASPPSPAPAQPPPAPPSSTPAPSTGQAVAAQPRTPGQWVYTQQYGWVWMPYGDAFTYAPADGYGEPYAYVYYPVYGWTWVVAPWVWGWGPWPYFGIAGPRHFAWYGHGWWRSPWRWHFRPAPAHGSFAFHGIRPAPARPGFVVRSAPAGHGFVGRGHVGGPGGRHR